MILDNFSLKTLDDFTLDKFTLDNFRLDGASGGGETIDHSTPVRVVNAAYDTSGNGGRKLVRLSNGWLVAAVYDTSYAHIKFYKSNDYGTTWIQLCYSQLNPLAGFGMASYGTRVYASISTNTYVGFTVFDALTVTNTQQGYTQIDSAQTSLGSGCSIACDSSGNLYAAWCSKNSTYLNSFNIRHAKSTDGGTTWTKADGTAGIDQLTITNTSSYDNTNPCIVCSSSGNPLIVFQAPYDATVKYIYCKYWTGSAWTQSTVYSAASYTQSNPCAVVSPDGHIHVAWQGLDVTDTTKYNLRYSESTDNGATWSAMEKLTSGNTVDRKTPSVTADGSSVPYIAYDDNGTLKWINDTGSWSSPETIAAGTNPSTCEYVDFTKPMTLFMGASDVEFYGVFTT
jgi:hypothetical protein